MTPLGDAWRPLGTFTGGKNDIIAPHQSGGDSQVKLLRFWGSLAVCSIGAYTVQLYCRWSIAKNFYCAQKCYARCCSLTTLKPKRDEGNSCS